MRKQITILILLLSNIALSQEYMTPESLWSLGRITALGITADGTKLIYKVSTPTITENKFTSKYYSIMLQGGAATELQDSKNLVPDKNTSPNGRYVLLNEEVKMEQTEGSDKYPDVPKSNVQIYESLNYRHWDTWHHGTFNHLVLRENRDGADKIDIMMNEPYDCPQKPFGGAEDYIWSPDSKSIYYVCKKKSGTPYATSTNTDIYQYNLATKTTTNKTENNKGYDTNPIFSPQGYLTWLSMKNDGYESDKNDILVSDGKQTLNLTSTWDGTVDNYLWSSDGKKIYFTAPIDGTKQLFELAFTGFNKSISPILQLTDGNYDVVDLIGIVQNKLYATRTDMNHAAEIYAFDLNKKSWFQLTNINTKAYQNISLSITEKRHITTTDGKKMLVWVIFPPNFDKTKKYPALLYCQGGPQSALTQSYSFRWNFQLMAAQGYIIIAPNRRGMPGHGVTWNEQISTDWGGQVMNDYLSAVDELAKEPYVDKSRIGCVGASYGGYSVFYLAGIHGNRFKSFIAHNGVFNLESMYGTTEEVFFTNWDLGGPYWDQENKVAQKSYLNFNPIKNVHKWNTPILIFQGGKDYRVPIGQGQEAFQAAQLQGIKSKFVYFPDENHWILQPQNALVWQREFFNWLKDTL
jgi:dipeptidyl aminopeptidase/acylaminoacyl peptidase